MDDGAIVRGLDSRRDLQADAKRLSQRHCPASDSIGQRRPLDELEHQRRAGVGRLHAVDGGDVRMIERGQCLCLALEAHQPISIRGERLGQDLDGDVAPQAAIPRTVDLAHAACPERRENLVRANAGTNEAHRTRLAPMVDRN